MSSPLILTVAPNGARKTRSDHPNLPITPAELAKTASQCLEAGASMIHLHVRDHKQIHTLHCDRYRDAITAIRSEVGPDLIIQVTSEAVGIYQAAEQMQMVRELKPEAVSLGVRELCPVDADEKQAAEFFQWLQSEKITPQYILYSAQDVEYFNSLRVRGIIPGDQVSILYVLGRYNKTQQSSAADLLPLLAANKSEVVWAVCAFGATEASCMLTAAGLGGHCRVGFENNLRLISGEIASDNAALVTQIAKNSASMNRRLATPTEARQLMGMR